MEKILLGVNLAFLKKIKNDETETSKKIIINLLYLRTFTLLFDIIRVTNYNLFNITLLHFKYFLFSIDNISTRFIITIARLTHLS